jgi:hypothetical protein
MDQEKYYLENKERLLEEFDDMGEFVNTVLSAEYSHVEIDAIMEEAHQEFENLLPQIPYIGGKGNRLTKNLVGSAMILALYKVLKNRGLTDRRIGKIVYEIAQEQVKHKNRVLIYIFGKLRFSRIIKRILRKMAAKSQKRLYPEDWIFTVVEGDGEDFDFGIDYTQCAICEFYKAQGHFEFAKYLCLIDFVTAKAANSGLKRTMTLAEGHDNCDFRWKKGGEVAEGWPPPWVNDD